MMNEKSEKPDKDDKEEKRPAFLIVLIIGGVALLFCLIWFFALRPVPAAPIEQPTEEPTEEATEPPTEEPTAVVTEEPTKEPTEEPTVEPTLELTVEAALCECGDGVCDAECENSDICAQDCECVDDGTCSDSETCKCRDCICENEPPATGCGSPCPAGVCGDGFQCTAAGVCWSGPICNPEPPEDGKGDCKCSGPYQVCDGKKKFSWDCASQNGCYCYPGEGDWEIGCESGWGPKYISNPIPLCNGEYGQ